MERTVFTAQDVSAKAAALAAPFLAKATALHLPQVQLDNVQAAAAAPSPTEDDYKSRLLKYIPAEIIAVYLTMDGVVKSAAAQLSVAQIEWVIFVILLVATPLYLWRIAGVTKIVQLCVSTISFAVWVFTLGGPFAFTTWYHPAFGALLLPLYTFLLPIIYRG